MTPPAGTEPKSHGHPACDSCAFAEKTNSKTYPMKCTVSKPIPMMVHEYCISWFGYVGCASHSAIVQPKFTSTELLLLANDEWKRREERKHLHENVPWCVGFISGFLTDKKWARDYVDKLLKGSEGK